MGPKWCWRISTRIYKWQNNSISYD